MQNGLPEVSDDTQKPTNSSTQTTVLQHGFLLSDAGEPGCDLPVHQQQNQPAQPDHLPPKHVQGHCGVVLLDNGVDAGVLGDRLRRLSGLDEHDRPKLPGQRISEYENALTASGPTQALGFKVTKRSDSPSTGMLLSDFPNEILTHILSHLHPDSHASVALVSKRFYSLVTSPHAWRMAFQRFFPGQDAVGPELPTAVRTWDEDEDDLVRSEIRYFTRLTPQASWRSEYLLRTRLLRSLARGKPGAGIGISSRSSQTTKKGSAVLTYNTRLPSMVTHIHGSFTSNGKKSPRVIHGTSDFCVGSASDPTNGKLEKWGLDDPFGFAQFNEVVPHLLPYGVGEGPAAVPNVMDVSQPYGIVGGEGFPGGRVHFRPSNEFRGKYLDHDPEISNAHSDIPKIPELSEGISSVWIAKSAAVPLVTSSMIGMMAGSTLGVVTAYALGQDSSGPRYGNGEISTRWVLSPGVPIISIKVDDDYTAKRKSSRRVWAVALNALGEVYYLTHPPFPPANKTKTDDSTKLAWLAGRTTYWHLIESTRREARPDEMGKNAVRGTYSPRSPSNDLGLTKDQMAAEAREIERFLRYKPAHFRKVCSGWDMRRRLEVDFASDNSTGTGESILVVCCGHEDNQTVAITRFCRSATSQTPSRAEPTLVEEVSAAAQAEPQQSLFGGPFEAPVVDAVAAAKLEYQASRTASVTRLDLILDEWQTTTLIMENIENETITTTALDNSCVALSLTHEDSSLGTSTPSNMPSTPTGQASSDVPGRRARLVAIGTSTGRVLMWNMRQGHASAGVAPLRVIQTESPEISALALTSLYVVHGGNDGLVQAWDPLASTLEPVRTLNSRSIARLPRQTMAHVPALRQSLYYSVGAIFLDPDSTSLQGIVSFGSFVRYWSYSSSSQTSRRKRRVRHSDIHGRVTGRRHGGGVKGYIAAEAEEMRDEQEHNARETARLKARFGVGLADLTEEEALQYAEMISQESLQLEEQRRTSASDTGSTADFDTTSTTGSLDTVTPEPSITGRNAPVAGSSRDVPAQNAGEDDYELQIQTALRLSLLESSMSDSGQSAPTQSPDGFEDSIVYKDKKGKSPAWSGVTPPESHTPVLGSANWATTASLPRGRAPTPPSRTTSALDQEDEDLQLALKLSLAEEESRQASIAAAAVADQDAFPALEGAAPWKGKGRAQW
ncbi:uncharacterized protein B0I36DRAFT_289121 [Microdochium trichocladiopsis]|uniref:F-box domain-containing protein n=1 Tax=Microdochium trichocladiopsis TaxID=1682393 RepID=A0A9P9BNF1_9PEZI|nr:uncharacterized protein B0I36DRAFT_289121 [Microdochium trichocladiopsis]KAH7031201.1 hypothetical protein B0I36DRAFT_289121 [Microdochium trichocladiopsis]